MNQAAADFQTNAATMNPTATEPPMYCFGGVLLEETCPTCAGAKRVMSKTLNGMACTNWCPKCAGVGRTLTAEGKAFCGFMFRHVKPHTHGGSLVGKTK